MSSLGYMPSFFLTVPCAKGSLTDHETSLEPHPRLLGHTCFSGLNKLLVHFFFKSFTSRTGFTPPWHLSPGIFRYLKGRENLLTEYKDALLNSCLFPENKI